MLGWDSGEVTTTLSVHPGDGGVVSPGMMNHFSSKALGLGLGLRNYRNKIGTWHQEVGEQAKVHSWVSHSSHGEADSS